mmetsp:Transcript_24565/g.36174  ORF Transcript_24565/g.36174 Transcript_24565/m.36174 type:complete len:94 (-) Transcript_24565:1724-2005(-)
MITASNMIWTTVYNIVHGLDKSIASTHFLVLFPPFDLKAAEILPASTLVLRSNMDNFLLSNVFNRLCTNITRSRISVSPSMLNILNFIRAVIT